MRWNTLILAACLSALTVSSVAAQTLDKIRKDGVINLGVRDSSVPFSYYDATTQRSIGYSVDVCTKIVDAIKAELGMPNLRVRQVQIDASNRMEFIEAGKAELGCGSSTNSADRQKRVAFSTTYFVAGGRLLSRKTSNIRTMADLKGRTVVTTHGTSYKDQLAEINSAQGFGMRLIHAKDHAEAFLMVEAGRAQAFYMDGMILFGVLASSRGPESYTISEEVGFVQPYGLMMPRNDPAFKKLVDGVVVSMLKSGEMEKLYNKWFLEPIPPKGQALGFPMSARTRKAFLSPTDSPNPKDY